MHNLPSVLPTIYIGQMVQRRCFCWANNKNEPPMSVVRSARNMENWTRSPMYHSYKVTIDCASQLRRRIHISANQKEDLPMETIDDSCKISLYLAKRFQQKRFQKLTDQKEELPIAPCLLADRDEMSNLYRWPSIKFRFIFQSGFRFLEIYQSETRIAYGGHICQMIGTK